MSPTLLKNKKVARTTGCRRQGPRGEKIVLTSNLLEILLLFSFSMFCRCQIIDFHKPTGPMGTHPRLFEWILHYYSKDSEGGAKVECTSKPPIYLQHQGQCHNMLVSYYSVISLYVLQFRAAFLSLSSLNWTCGFISVIFLFSKSNIKVCIFIGWKSWMCLGSQLFDMCS